MVSVALLARVAQNASAARIAAAKAEVAGAAPPAKAAAAPQSAARQTTAPARADRYEASPRRSALLGMDTGAARFQAAPRTSAALADEARALRQNAQLQGRNGGASRPAGFKIEKDAQRQTVIKTDAKDDVVNVRALSRGRLEVEVNGEKTILSKRHVDAGVVLNVGDGNNKVTIDENVKVGLGVIAGKGDDIIKGGSGDDVISTGDGKNWVDAGKGDDMIMGGKDKDLLRGGDGDDRMLGGDGDDQLLGGDGHDKIIGGDGNDHIMGGAGDDYIEGNAGKDVIYGEDGRDTIHGGKDKDAIYGGAGDDFLDGGKGDDYLQGDDGHDRIFGGQGDDTLQGGAGRDVLAGGYGKDNVDGGAGDDKIFTEARDTTAKDASDQHVAVELAGDEDRRGQPRYDRVGHRVADGSDTSDTSDSAKKYREEYKDRLEDDLDTMRSTPSGRALLERLDKAYDKKGGHVFVEPKVGENDQTNVGDSAWVRYDRTDHRWTDNPTDWQKAPNVIGLYHELVHALQHGEDRAPTGKTNGVKNVELDAVGLPYDHDGKRRTPMKTPAAGEPNESAFRADLEYETRSKY